MIKCKTCNEAEAKTKTGQCKKCWRRDYRQINKDKIRPVARAYYIKHRDKYNQMSREWTKKHGRGNRIESPQELEEKQLRRETRRLYPLKDKSCQFCPSQATHHHHYTKPIDVDCFWYVCTKCHNKIHHPEINGEIQITESVLKAMEMQKEIAKRRPPKINAIIEPEELLKILQVIRREHHKLAYLLAWYSGCKISEVLNLEPSDINWKDKTILIRNRNPSKNRIAPLPEVLKEEMLQMFPLKKLIQARALQKAFVKDCEKAGILEYKPSAHFQSLRNGNKCRSSTKSDMEDK